MKVNEITEAVIGAAIEVHRARGPGLPVKKFPTFIIIFPN
jgi:hypothetical protein